MVKVRSIEERNKVSFFEKIHMFLVILQCPIVLAWALLKSPFSPYGRAKSWKRILADKFLFNIVTNMNRRQARLFFGTTRGLYDKFVKEKGWPQVVEELGDDARLLWIGPRQTERVLLYFHGGALLLAMPGFAPAFWRYIQENLEKRGKPTGVAILNYTFVPDATFPTQLKQAVLAVQHLLDSGVKPENLQLVGDSAGATLVHGVLSHLVHPLDGIPKLNLSAPLGGAFMLSLWARLLDKDGCLYTNEGNGDFLNGRSITYWGTKVMDGVPKSVIPYLEANSAPEDWLKGVDKHIKRILMSAGGIEVLRDEIIKYANNIKMYHKDVTFVVQENGGHNDPYTDFFTEEKDLGKLTPLMLEWVDESFSKTT